MTGGSADFSKFMIAMTFLQLAIAGHSQDGSTGKWFMFSRNRIIELTITRDSLVSRQLYEDGTPWPESRHYREAQPLKLYDSAGRLILNRTDSLFRSDPVNHPFQPILVPEAEYESYKRLPGTDQMKAEDFARYLDRMIATRVQLDSAGKSADPQQVLFYGYSKMRLLFAEMGFSPFITGTQLNELFLRFKSDSLVSIKIRALDADEH